MIDPENTEFTRARELASEDFDGHTDFRNLSPEQRLQWLSDIMDFHISASLLRSQLMEKVSINDLHPGIDA